MCITEILLLDFSYPVLDIMECMVIARFLSSARPGFLVIWAQVHQPAMRADRLLASFVQANETTRTDLLGSGNDVHHAGRSAGREQVLRSVCSLCDFPQPSHAQAPVRTSVIHVRPESHRLLKK